jgi:tetratricopeptide (TPR) repeat protein
LKIQPAEPEYLCALASLHCEIGQKDEAAKILDHALVIDPSNARCADMLRSISTGNGAGVV